MVHLNAIGAWSDESRGEQLVNRKDPALTIAAQIDSRIRRLLGTGRRLENATRFGASPRSQSLDTSQVLTA